MAITLVGADKLGAASGADVTLTFPTLQEGDVVYVWGGHSANLGTGKGPQSAGWTLLVDVDTTSLKGGYWRKVMGPSPDANVVCEGGANANDAVCYGFYALRGVDTATPEDTTPTQATDVATNPNAPSITTVTNGAWVLALAMKGDNDGVHTTPSGYANALDVGVNDINDFSIGGATKEVVTAGAENPPAWADWSGSDRWVAVSIAVKPDAGSVRRSGWMWVG